MINGIFHAHSGLRYAILLAAVVTLVILALGAINSRPYERQSRGAMALFTGLLDLQILLGIVLVVLGCFYSALMGHLMMMVLAAVIVHGCGIFARKQSDGRRAHTIALAGVVLGLALIAGGIASIGRSPFGTSGSATCTAASR